MVDLRTQVPDIKKYELWRLHNLYIPRVVASAIFSVGYFTPAVNLRPFSASK